MVQNGFIIIISLPWLPGAATCSSVFVFVAQNASTETKVLKKMIVPGEKVEGRKHEQEREWKREREMSTRAYWAVRSFSSQFLSSFYDPPSLIL